MSVCVFILRVIKLDEDVLLEDYVSFLHLYISLSMVLSEPPFAESLSEIMAAPIFSEPVLHL